ncbi:MAG: hypothetical protein LBB56_00295 [Chitinispirillales bacterium]|jgi:hypothetical protein|nr:hypothetical protein [Chitinispirillales bacterium]
MRYTAKSVKTALEGIKNEGFRCAGLDELRCPIPGLILDDTGRKCCIAPQNCDDAGQKSCIRMVYVYRGTSAKIAPFVILKFYFTISDTNHDGFIEEYDSPLRRLIDGGYMPESGLSKVA